MLMFKNDKLIDTIDKNRRIIYETFAIGIKNNPNIKKNKRRINACNKVLELLSYYN